NDSALRGGALLPGTNGTRVGLTSQDQVQPREEHCLTCPGFSGDDGESGCKFDASFKYNPEVLESNFLDHGFSGPPRHPVTGRLNFLTSRSVNGPGLSRASRTGLEPLRTSMWDPSGASNTRRPSHHTRPAEEER